jgi:hypothetical protein
MEPAVGIEPTTDGLQNRCSTAELSWPLGVIRRVLNDPCLDGQRGECMESVDRIKSFSNFVGV